ncbi:helix-turn-helix domain-containing protein [Paenibacillus senegalimassiliensis]|uniref:helix-turn-helix domain-containing protein n=1 Tax=Paenibacillus senegalimassiliensis TaxID=1737426 RepID=UPI00073E66F9|nr:helix-turn-helix domain-containing protein [Paenibacillus senegalimassiliensis]
MTIGDRIKKRRKELRLSVDQLSASLGKNRATVYRYEGDEIDNMPLSILEPLAKALKTTPAYLMGWEDEAIPESIELTQHEEDILRKYNALDDIGKYTVDTTLEAQYERCTKPHLTVIAAHNDDYSEEQQKLMREDLDMLEQLHKKKRNK